MVITSWSVPARPLPGQLPEEILLATEKRVARAKDGNRSGMFCSVSLTLKQGLDSTAFWAAAPLKSQS